MSGGGGCGLVLLGGSHSAREGGPSPTRQDSLWALLDQSKSGVLFTPSGQDSLLDLKGAEEAQGSQNGL